MMSTGWQIFASDAECIGLMAILAPICSIGLNDN